jgi:hypothetical protein
MINYSYFYIAFDKRILNKILEIGQKNSFLLRELTRNQLKFEHKTEERLNDISDSVAILKEQKSVLNDVKQEAKSNAFYKVGIFILFIFFIGFLLFKLYL